MTHKNKHTPAPWVLEHDKTNREFVIFGFDGHLVTEVLDNQVEDKANANLISAAPLMLEALEDIYAIVKGNKSDSAKLAMIEQLCFNPIKKARGEMMPFIDFEDDLNTDLLEKHGNLYGLHKYPNETNAQFRRRVLEHRDYLLTIKHDFVPFHEYVIDNSGAHYVEIEEKYDAINAIKSIRISVRGEDLSQVGEAIFDWFSKNTPSDMFYHLRFNGDIIEVFDFLPNMGKSIAYSILKDDE